MGWSSPPGRPSPTSPTTRPTSSTPRAPPRIPPRRSRTGPSGPSRSTRTKTTWRTTRTTTATKDPPVAGRYRAIFFDLDGTLIDEEAGVPQARAAVAASLRARGHAVADDAYSAASDAVIRDLLAANGGEWPFVWSREAVIADTLSRLGAPAAAAGEMAAVYLRTRLSSRAPARRRRGGPGLGPRRPPRGADHQRPRARAAREAPPRGTDRLLREPDDLRRGRGQRSPTARSSPVRWPRWRSRRGRRCTSGTASRPTSPGARAAGLDAVWLRAPGHGRAGERGRTRLPRHHVDARVAGGACRRPRRRTAQWPAAGRGDRDGPHDGGPAGQVPARPALRHPDDQRRRRRAPADPALVRVGRAAGRGCSARPARPSCAASPPTRAWRCSSPTTPTRRSAGC